MRLLRFFSLIIVILSLGIAFTPAYAGAITVNSLLVTTTTGDGVCTLPEAIIVANADTVGHADCGTGSGTDTITINVAGQIDVSNVMSVSSTIIINEGAGDVVLNGINSRMFSVLGDLTINGLTLQNGVGATTGGCIRLGTNVTLTINNSSLQNCQSGGFGGAVGGSGTGVNLTISNSTFSNNTATVGGAIYVEGVLSISSSTFTTNTSSSTTGSGGAIFFTASGDSSITNTLFSQNTGTASSSSSSGGALATAIGGGFTLSISGSTFSNNQINGGGSAGQGGAIYSRSSGTLTISNSVFTENQALGNNALGGAIYTSLLGSTSVTSSRFQSNTATGTGDAFYSSSLGTDSITGSCIVNNGDTAVVDDLGSATTATGNWWGVDWGPLISTAGGASAVSNGDSVNGSGTSSVNVGLTSAGSLPNTPPTGNWLTVAPTVAGVQCMICTEVSSVGHGRTCS